MKACFRVLLVCLLTAAVTVSVNARPRKLKIPVGVCSGLGNAERLKTAGADYIEEGVSGFLVPDKPDADFARKLALKNKTGLPMPAVNGFLPGRLTIVGPEAKHDEIIAWADTAFRRAARSGIRYIVFGSGAARRIPEGFSRERAEEQFIGLCRRLGPVAAEYGITVVIEPLNRGETNLINTVTEGAGIVRRVGHKNIRLLCDFFHMAQENESPQAIVDAGPYIKHCHIAERDRRTAPGVEGDDFRPYLRALKRIGYKGGISVECLWTDFDGELAPALQEIRRQLETL